MKARRELEKKIEKKNQELAEYETKMRECKIYIEALNEALKLIPKNPEEQQKINLRAGNIADTRKFLRESGKSSQIKDILLGIGKEATTNNIRSLSSQLNNYVRKGEIFTRPMPNTYGLIEFELEETNNDLPDDFGESVRDF